MSETSDKVLEKEVAALKKQVEELQRAAALESNEKAKLAAELVLYKEAQEVSNENCETIINNMGDPVFVKDDQSKLVLVNDAFCEVFGRSRDEIIGKTLAEDVPLEEREHFLKIDKQVISTGKESIVEEKLTVGENDTRTISTRKRQFIDKTGNKFLIGVIRDITEEKLAQAAVKRSRERLEALVEERTLDLKLSLDELNRSNALLKSSIESHKGLIILSVDTNYKYYYFNKSHEQTMIHLYGLKPKIGDCIFDCMTNAEDVAKLKGHYDKALKGEAHTEVSEYGTSETRLYYETTFSPVLSGKKVIGVTAFSQNITVRIEAEKTDKLSEERMRLVLENVEDIISVLDEEGIFESVNKTTQGNTKEAVIGTSFFNLHEEKKAAEIRVKYDKLKETGEPFVLENTYTGPDGSAILYWTKFLAIFHKQQFFKTIAITRDVTAERNHERSVMKAVLRGQEQERKRLGAELHDGIGQILSAISLDVSQIRIDARPEEQCNVAEELLELNGKVQTAIKEVRNISHDLMPQVLESFGLKEALNQLCSTFHNKSGIEVKFDHVDVVERYDPFTEVNLYRIAQELLNNIYKHAACEHVFVNLMDYETLLSLTVEDDGVGFDTHKEFKGIGIRNVFSRVAALEGEIDLESADKLGTLISIEVPKTRL